MTTLLLAFCLANLTSPGAITATPRHTIDQVLARFTASNRTATVTGIHFDRHTPGFLHWDVYYVLNRTSMEVEVDDVNLSASRPKTLRQSPLRSRLTFRQALARTRELQSGAITSLELERDEEKGIVWSAEVQHGGRTYELYFSPNNGRLIDREIMRKADFRDDL